MSIYGGFERIAEVNYTQMYDSYYYNENGLLMIIPESEFSKIEKPLMVIIFTEMS